MATVEDKAGKEFWNEQWSGNLVPDAADPSKSGLGNLFTKRMDRLFSDIFRDQETEGKLFLELGCGSSIWLPYFAKRFGFEVSGIDYSPAGVDKERAILKKAGVDGDIIQADFFDPPNELLEKFDAVYSYGVAEHFVPTERAISAFASFLRPGGVMITIVPNMTGSVGFLQRIADRQVYDIHVPLTSSRLAEAHRSAGLLIDESLYFPSSGYGVVNAASAPGGLRRSVFEHVVRNLGRISAGVWYIENKSFELPRTRFFSPYVACIARKPFDASVY